MKVATNYVPDESKYYLTERKEYEVYFVGARAIIVNDNKQETVIISDESGCAHLDYYCWDIIDEN